MRFWFWERVEGISIRVEESEQDNLDADISDDSIHEGTVSQ